MSLVKFKTTSGEKMKKVDFDHAKRTVIQLVLTGCGLTVPLCYQSSQ